MLSIARQRGRVISLWISKVDDLVSSEDSVQVNSSLNRDSNQNFFGTGVRRPIKTVGLSEITRDTSAIVTFSQASVKQSVSYAASLSGVDINLFSAD